MDQFNLDHILIANICTTDNPRFSSSKIYIIVMTKNLHKLTKNLKLLPHFIFSGVGQVHVLYHALRAVQFGELSRDVLGHTIECFISQTGRTCPRFLTTLQI